MKSCHKRPLDEEFEKELQEIKRLAFRLLRESQDLRMKSFYNGLEADKDPLGSCLNGIIRQAMEAAHHAKECIKLAGQAKEPRKY